MADGGESRPPDTDDIKYFKCHPTTKVSLKVCVICENAYHNSDFKKLKGGIELGKILVLYPEHSDIDITSNLKENELSFLAKQIIAKIKLYEQEKVQDQILNNISSEVIKENLEWQNLTIVGQEEDGFTVLKANVLLYKDLISEMRGKNNLLQELLDKTKMELKELKEQRGIGQITYAGALTGQPASNLEILSDFMHKEVKMYSTVGFGRTCSSYIAQQKYAFSNRR